MMKNTSAILYVFAIAIFFGSCVSSKKYKELESVKDFYAAQAAKLKALKEEKATLMSEKRQCNVQLRQTTSELEETVAKAQSLQRTNQDLVQRYDKLLQQNKDLLQASSSEIKTLTEELSQKRDELDRRTKRLDSLQNELSARESVLNEWQQKVNNLQAALSEKEASVARLQDKINAALLGFSDADLSVSERNGKLYVSLSQNLLFQPGSDKIDPKGRQALQQLAEVLTANRDIEVMVEGHTDTDGTAAFNWDLSTSRATSVVKVLAANGVDQSRMTAAGRSFFQPVAPNDNAVNKAKNRRVEIILSPKLDELYNIIRS